MDRTVGFGPLQIGPWENLLKEVFEIFDETTIEEIITSFNKLAHDDMVEGIATDSDEENYDDDEPFNLQQRFFKVLNGSNDKLQSAKHLKQIMANKGLHDEGQPMVDKVRNVIHQLKEYQRQEIKASDIFVGRDRDKQLILGLLGVQTAPKSDIICSRDDEDFVRNWSRRVKGVYLSGIGGQGKTTLAKKICFELDHCHGPWKTILVSLRNKSSVEDVLQAILSELDIFCAVPRRDELFKYLLDFIQSTKNNTLICLDDCDALDKYSMKDVAEIFVKMDRLPEQCSKVKFLLTSRTKFDDKHSLKSENFEVKLGGNLIELELDCLADDEAITLLRHCSDVSDDEMDDEKAHNIVTCCALSPLAVTMVAQLMKEEKFTPQQILFHLEKDEKHATKAMKINFCIAETFRKLDRKLFASVVHLAVFQSSKFDLKSAIKIIGLDKVPEDRNKATKILQKLHDYHFLEVFIKEKKYGNEKDYSLHPLVYRFLAEQLKAGQFSEIYLEAVLRFIDLMEVKVAKIFKMMSTKCKKGIAEMEENKVHILQYYDFLMDDRIKSLLPKYPKRVKDKLVLVKKKVSDMTDLILYDVKKRRLFLSEARRAAETRCDAMEIFWTVENADVLSTLHQKPDLALDSLDKLAAGRFAALRNLHDQPDYPPLVMALYHKIKGQAFWKLLRQEEALQHICLSEYFYAMLRPAESYRVLKAKLLKEKGLIQLDLKQLDECERTLHNAYELLKEQVYVKEGIQNDTKVNELKKLSLQIPEFFRHFGSIEIEKAHRENDPDRKSKHLNKALEFLNEGMELDKQLHIESLDDFAAKMKLCADVYIEQGLLDEAEKFAKSAESQRRHCLQLPHINVTESVYQMGKVYTLKGLDLLQEGNKKHGKHYLLCAEDWFDELEQDHLINGSIPTRQHPLYSAIKQGHLDLYKRLYDSKKVNKLQQFYTDIENGKYDSKIKSFKDQFQSMMYTPQEILDQIYDGGGKEFGDNDNIVIQVEPDDEDGTRRDRLDSGRGGSSVDSSMSSMSDGGSLTESIRRMEIQKSLSLEDDVFQQVPGDQKRVKKRQKTVSDD